MRTINAMKWILIFSFTLIMYSCNNNSAIQKNEIIELENIKSNEEHNSVDDVLLENNMLTEKHSNEEKNIVNVSSNTFFKSNLKIIMNANARYKVNNLKVATERIQEFTILKGGYISEMKYRYDMGRKINNLIIKIPQIAFNETIKDIETYTDSTDYLNISTKDVTEEYFDIKSRLKTKLEVKNRYEEVLRRNAKTVKDIIETETEIKKIQEEIEVVQGRLNYLNNKVLFSTIEIDLYEKIDHNESEIVIDGNFKKEALEALQFGLSGTKNLVLLFLHIWPLLVITLIVLIWWRKKNFRK